MTLISAQRGRIPLSALVICTAALALAALIAAPCVNAADAPSPNITTVVISGGPFAGSYKAENTACLTVKARNSFGSGWRDFSPPPGKKSLEEAGIEVRPADAPGAKTGHVLVKLTDGVSKTPKLYDFSNAPLTVTRSGAGGKMEFDGKAPDGAHLHVVAVCVEVEQF